MSVGHASGAEDKYSLLILYGRAISRGCFGGCRFRQRLVNCGHASFKIENSVHATKPWQYTYIDAKFACAPCGKLAEVEVKVNLHIPIGLGLELAKRPRKMP